MSATSLIFTSIIVSLSIYVLAGREIFAKRRQLRAFGNPVVVEVENPFTSFKTTEIRITSEIATTFSPSPDVSDAFGSSEDKIDPCAITTRKPTIHRSPSRSTTNYYDQYSVEIGSAPLSPRFETQSTVMPRTSSMVRMRNNKAALEANTAAWGYTKVALLFFVSLLVTWVSECQYPEYMRYSQLT